MESAVGELHCQQKQCGVIVREGRALGSRPLQALELQASFRGWDYWEEQRAHRGVHPLHVLAVAGIWAPEGEDEVPEARLFGFGSLFLLVPDLGPWAGFSSSVEGAPCHVSISLLFSVVSSGRTRVAGLSPSPALGPLRRHVHFQTFTLITSIVESWMVGDLRRPQCPPRF